MGYCKGGRAREYCGGVQKWEVVRMGMRKTKIHVFPEFMDHVNPFAGGIFLACLIH